jgi:hypothetical protein
LLCGAPSGEWKKAVHTENGWRRWTPEQTDRQTDRRTDRRTDRGHKLRLGLHNAVYDGWHLRTSAERIPSPDARSSYDPLA